MKRGENRQELVGIGLYTPAEAARLIDVNPLKIARWLRGHEANGKRYDALWVPQVDLGDGKVYLGFRDLMEVRVASAFIERGLSAIKVRRAIEIARSIIGEDRPLSTTRFRTDGSTVFLEMAREDGKDQLIDLFRKQYAFKGVVEPSLKNIEFDDVGVPRRWFPLGKAAKIIVDPNRSFGHPIEADSGVPTEVLAAAVEAEGGVSEAAKAFGVSPAAVKRAVEFQAGLEMRKAA